MSGSLLNPAVFAAALTLPAVRQSVPLILAAMGGILSERCGIINIAQEGMMLGGAFVGIWCGQMFGPALGLAAAMATGIGIASLHYLLTQKLRVNHVVSGIAINLLALHTTTFLHRKLFIQSEPIREAKITNLINPTFFVLAAIILPFAVHFLLFQTVLGLRMRAAGENARSARMAGIQVPKFRLIGVLASGILASAAGAYLAISQFGRFSDDMISGRGYIALAAVICGKWKPVLAFSAAMGFGLFDALQIQLQGTIHLPGELLRSLPYVAAIVVAAVVRPVPPAALGTNDDVME